ncbi:MAG TPA: hypothetical protein PKE32_00960, partial [Miltoncostaeaceae bacterium]|nr:hypothetical protein [Miltoncostaeaceae bacterium]
MPSPPRLGDRPDTRADSPFRRAPYLTRVTTDEARVRWVGAPGRKLRALARTDAGVSVRGQRGVFTELEPGTAHRWLVSVDGVPSAGGSFVTAPSDAASSFEFAAIGGTDGRTVVDPHRARLLADLPARLLVGVGALGGVAPGCDLNAFLFDPLGDALRRMPFYGAVADPREGPGGAWPELVAALEWPGAGARYAARYGPVQLLMLGGPPRQDDRAWVRRECARRGAGIRLVVLHRTAPDDRALLAACADLPVSAVLMPG